MTERVTLITGASAGIGTELARIFAANGHRLALTARRADRLNQLAGEITAAGGAQPIVIACDLEQADACDKIEAALASAGGVELEYLVNNAGFGMFGRAIKRDRNDQLGMIAVNIRALTDLTLRFADQLIRNRGGILNIGSIAGFLPGPGMAVYYASKAYVLSFSEAMRRELAPHGVRVTVVCPGPVLDRIPGARRVQARLRFRDSQGFARRGRAAGLSGPDGQQAGSAAGPRHQAGALPAAVLPPLLHPGRGRRIPAPESLNSGRNRPPPPSLARDLLRFSQV